MFYNKYVTDVYSIITLEFCMMSYNQHTIQANGKLTHTYISANK